DEIAQNHVVLDLERCNAAFLGIARLELGDNDFAIALEVLQLVERCGIARGDKPAVAGKKREFVFQRAVKLGDDLQKRGRLQEILRDGIQQSGLIFLLELWNNGGGLLQPVAQSSQITRPAAAQGDACKS